MRTSSLEVRPQATEAPPPSAHQELTAFRTGHCKDPLVLTESPPHRIIQFIHSFIHSATHSSSYETQEDEQGLVLALEELPSTDKGIPKAIKMQLHAAVGESCPRAGGPVVNSAQAQRLDSSGVELVEGEGRGRRQKGRKMGVFCNKEERLVWNRSTDPTLSADRRGADRSAE